MTNKATFTGDRKPVLLEPMLHDSLLSGTLYHALVLIPWKKVWPAKKIQGNLREGVSHRKARSQHLVP